MRLSLWSYHCHIHARAHTHGLTFFRDAYRITESQLFLLHSKAGLLHSAFELLDPTRDAIGRAAANRPITLQLAKARHNRITNDFAVHKMFHCLKLLCYGACWSSCLWRLNSWRHRRYRWHWQQTWRRLRWRRSRCWWPCVLWRGWLRLLFTFRVFGQFLVTSLNTRDVPLMQLFGNIHPTLSFFPAAEDHFIFISSEHLACIIFSFLACGRLRRFIVHRLIGLLYAAVLLLDTFRLNPLPAALYR
mmetsp:Transcript_55982/g.92604  ORF Transcript_55982/g.92604 Transcript_55982/m.92604 type:complete len:246 (-) Transcript_55982:44-781(-)